MRNHVHVSNYEWYLFHLIPLVGGNASENPLTPFVILRDDVKMDKLQDRLTREAKRQDRRIENLVWNNYDTVLFTLPFVNIPLPIPYFITYREMQLSGELK